MNNYIYTYFPKNDNVYMRIEIPPTKHDLTSHNKLSLSL